MGDLSFTSVAVVAAVAVAAPLAVALSGLRLPAVVVELLLGVAVGPELLGWAEVDEPVEVLALLGLAFLLLLAGLELDVDRLRGRLLRVTGLAYGVSFALALAVGFGLRAGDLVRSPLLAAILLGVEMGLVRPTNYVALVAAGLLSVIFFPPLALSLLKRSAPSGDRGA